MINQILELIDQFDQIIIHRHVIADGDAYGSSLGLKKWIQLNYPQKKVYAVGEDYRRFQHLGVMDVIPDTEYVNALVIVTDTGNVERIDDQRFDQGKFLVKIDHHPDQTPYGDLSWVDPSYTSASEMIGDLIMHANKKIDQDLAQTIYFGIVTDSLRFMTPTVSSRTFRVAGFLHSTDFNLQSMNQEMYVRHLNVVQAQAKLIDGMELAEGVGALYLTPSLVEEYHLDYQQNGMFANLLKDINGIDIWVTFAINQDATWRVEFRSKQVPINEVARKWGGGGHPLASGAKINDLADAKLIIADLQALLKAPA